MLQYNALSGYLTTLPRALLVKSEESANIAGKSVEENLHENGGNFEDRTISSGEVKSCNKVLRQ